MILSRQQHFHADPAATVGQEVARTRCVVLVHCNQLSVKQRLIHHGRHVRDISSHYQGRADHGVDAKDGLILIICLAWAV